MSPTCDVVVIGGGIMGCSVAFQLARRGLATSLVERGSLGMGPTARSAGIIRQHYSNELTAKMAVYGLRTFQDFSNRIGGECGFRRTGFVLLVPGAYSAELESNIEMQRQLGIGTELLASEALAELLPGLDPEGIGAAAYEPESGYASLYDITPDWHPVIDEVPHGSGFIHCAGFSGHGFKLAPAAGLLVSDMIVDEGAAECDPHLFRLSRFAENDRVPTQYEIKILG